jgi:hypothetical protein
MKNAALNAFPSPSDPAQVVDHPTLPGYYRLYGAVNEILAAGENDGAALRQLADIREFADRKIVTLEGSDASVGPPAPPPPAPSPMMGMAQPQAGGIPGASVPGTMPPATPGGDQQQPPGLNMLSGLAA